MDFSIPEPTKAMLARFRQFMDENVYPKEELLLAEKFDELNSAIQKLRAKAKKEGLWAPQMPKDVGGMGLSVLEHGLVSQELGRSPLGHFTFNCQAPDAGNMELIHEFGSKEQKDTFLKPLVAGDIRSCFSMTEPGYPGANPVWMGTTAVKDGDDYVINGRKWFTSSCDGASFAIVMAVTNPDAKPHERASQIIVPTDNPGFTRVRNIPMMGGPGEGYYSHSEVTYENCRVPQSNLLGEEGAGFKLAQHRLGPGRIHHCMRWLGICERAFEMMVKRAATREMAPDDVLGNRQIVQGWIAECRAEINAARLMVLHAAWTIDNIGKVEAREEVSLIKFYVANVMMKVVDRAIQVHGALGITEDIILSHFYRHERGARIYDGPDEVHKMVVAKRWLKKYR